MTRIRFVYIVVFPILSLAASAIGAPISPKAKTSRAATEGETARPAAAHAGTPTFSVVGHDVRDWAKENWPDEKVVILKIQPHGKGLLRNQTDDGAVIAVFSQAVWIHLKGVAGQTFKRDCWAHYHLVAGQWALQDVAWDAADDVELTGPTAIPPIPTAPSTWWLVSTTRQAMSRWMYNGEWVQVKEIRAGRAQKIEWSSDYASASGEFPMSVLLEKETKGAFSPFVQCEIQIRANYTDKLWTPDSGMLVCSDGEFPRRESGARGPHWFGCCKPVAGGL